MRAVRVRNEKQEHTRCARCEEKEKRHEAHEKTNAKGSSQRKHDSHNRRSRTPGVAVAVAGAGRADDTRKKSAHPFLFFENEDLPPMDITGPVAVSAAADGVDEQYLECDPESLYVFHDLERGVQATLKQSRDDLQYFGAPSGGGVDREERSHELWHPATAVDLADADNAREMQWQRTAAAALFPDVAEGASVLQELRAMQTRTTLRAAEKTSSGSPAGRSGGGESDSPSSSSSSFASGGACRLPRPLQPGATVVEVLEAVERAGQAADGDSDGSFRPRKYVMELLRNSLQPQVPRKMEGGDLSDADADDEDEDALQALQSFPPEALATLHSRAPTDPHVYHHAIPLLACEADAREARELLQYRITDAPPQLPTDVQGRRSPKQQKRDAPKPAPAEEAAPLPQSPPPPLPPAPPVIKMPTKAEREAEQRALAKLIVESLPQPSAEIPVELREEIARQRRLLEHLTEVQQDHLRRLAREQQAETRRRVQAPKVSSPLDLRAALSPEQRRLGLQNVIEPFEVAQQLQSVAADPSKPLPPLITITTTPAARQQPQPQPQQEGQTFEPVAEREARFYEKELYRVRSEYRGLLADEKAKRKMEQRAFAELLQQQTADMDRRQRETVQGIQREARLQQRESASLAHQLAQAQAVQQDRRLERQQRRHEELTHRVVDRAVDALHLAAPATHTTAPPRRPHEVRLPESPVKRQRSRTEAGKPKSTSRRTKTATAAAPPAAASTVTPPVSEIPAEGSEDARLPDADDLRDAVNIPTAVATVRPERIVQGPRFFGSPGHRPKRRPLATTTPPASREHSLKQFAPLTPEALRRHTYSSPSPKRAAPSARATAAANDSSTAAAAAAASKDLHGGGGAEPSRPSPQATQPRFLVQEVLPIRDADADEVGRYREQLHLIEQSGGTGFVPITNKEAYRALTVGGRSAFGRPVVMLGLPAARGSAQRTASSAFERTTGAAGADGREAADSRPFDFYSLGAESEAERREALWSAYRAEERRLRELEAGGISAALVTEPVAYTTADTIAEEEDAGAAHERVRLRPLYHRQHERFQRAPLQTHRAGVGAAASVAAADEAKELLEARKRLALLRRTLLTGTGGGADAGVPVVSLSPLPPSYKQLVDRITNETVHAVVGEQSESALVSQLMGTIEAELLSAVLDHKIEERNQQQQQQQQKSEEESRMSAGHDPSLQQQQQQEREREDQRRLKDEESLRRLLEGYLEAAVLKEMLTHPAETAETTQAADEGETAAAPGNRQLQQRPAAVSSAEMERALSRVIEAAAAGDDYPIELVRAPGGAADPEWLKDKEPGSEGCPRLIAYEECAPAATGPATTLSEQLPVLQASEEGGVATLVVRVPPDGEQTTVSAAEEDGTVPLPRPSVTAGSSGSKSHEFRIVLDLNPCISQLSALATRPPPAVAEPPHPTVSAETPPPTVQAATALPSDKAKRKEEEEDAEEASRWRAMREEQLKRREQQALEDSEATGRDTVVSQESLHRQQVWMMVEWARASYAAHARERDRRAAEESKAQQQQQQQEDDQTRRSPPLLPAPAARATSTSEGGEGTNGETIAAIRDPVTRFIFEWLKEYGDRQALEAQRTDVLSHLRTAADVANAPNGRPEAAPPAPRSSTTETTSSVSSWLSSTNPSSYGGAGGHRFLHARERMVAVPARHPVERGRDSADSSSSGTTRYTAPSQADRQRQQWQQRRRDREGSTATSNTRSSSDGVVRAYRGDHPHLQHATRSSDSSSEDFHRLYGHRSAFAATHLSEGFSSSSSSSVAPAAAVAPPHAAAPSSGALPFTPARQNQQQQAPVGLEDRVRALQAESSAPPQVFDGHQLRQQLTHSVQF